MTNKEIAKTLVEAVNNRPGDTVSSLGHALKILIEHLNSPTKYSKSNAYHNEHIEQAFFDLLNSKRFNGVHFMDLSEPMNNKKG